ncbi:MAG: hypothetical protein GXY83_13450 [Rhodopirellula sp.]|nr:hypothetical protein [Rhodopirellula sp.]
MPSMPMKLLLAILCICLASTAESREWTDSSGQYTVDADLIAFNDELAVLKKADRDLVAVPLEKLSAEDREYVQSKDAAQVVRQAADQMQTWTFRGGKKAVGRVIDFGRKELAIERRRGKIYVNDRLFENLPQLYQWILPQIINHFEGTTLSDARSLNEWVVRQRGETRRYTLEGVRFELENGDLYGIPFFFFSEDDLKVLKSGWEAWLAAANANNQMELERQNFLLQSHAWAYQQDRMVSQQIAMWQAAQDWLDLWEVQMLPRPGVAGGPRSVVVPARNSMAAKQAAAVQNPQYAPGAVRKIRRRN